MSFPWQIHAAPLEVKEQTIRQQPISEMVAPGTNVIDAPGTNKIDAPRTNVTDAPGTNVIDAPGTNVMDAPGIAGGRPARALFTFGALGLFIVLLGYLATVKFNLLRRPPENLWRLNKKIIIALSALVVIFLIGALVLVFLAGKSETTKQVSPPSQWPVFHGDAARTGFSNSKIPSSAKVLWEITVDQFREFGVNDFEIQRPVIDQGKVFFATGQVFAADLYSGKFIWNYKGDRPDFYPSFLAAGDGNIFITVTNSSLLKNMSEGFIYALSEDDGKFLWKYQTQKQISHSSPVLAEGKVFVGDESGSVYAIDAKDGKLVWQQQLEADQIHSSPAYEGGVIYVGTETADYRGGGTDRGSYFYALDAKDGKVLWRFESDWRSNTLNLIHGTPAVSNGVVYFGSENGWFFALNKDSGKVIWKKIITQKERQAGSPGLVGVSTAPALGYGKIFVGTWEGKFLALSQKDGSTIWEYNYGDDGDGDGTDSSAVVADGKVCLGSHGLDFYCFNQENGKVLWKEKLGGPSAALSDGILVVPNDLAAAESPGSILVAFSDATYK